MKKLLSCLGACLAIFMATSCSSNNNDQNYLERTYPGCFASVSEMSTGATAIYNSVNYQVRLYFGNGETAEAQISGLKLPDGTSYPTMSLKNLSWTIDKDGWFVVKSKENQDIKPTLSNYGTVPVFRNFELRYLDRQIQGVPNPGLCVRYNINGVYSVTSSYARHTVYGTTESTNVETGAIYTTQATNYVLSFNMETRRLEITMNNSRFVQNMPTGFNIVLKNIPFVIDGAQATWFVDAITPEIGGTPYPAYPITNLSGAFNFGAGLNLDFDCEPRSLGKFHVSADCEYSNLPS